MPNDLPTFIDPSQLAHRRHHLKGRAALAEMTRVHDCLCDVQGDVLVDWQFDHDHKHRIIINGNIHAQVIMLCMRCMQPMPWKIEANTALILINEGQSEDEMPEDYEVIPLTTAPMSLISLIEDELILALPLVAKHTVCPSNEYSIAETEPLTSHNPFGMLSQLKK